MKLHLITLLTLLTVSLLPTVGMAAQELDQGPPLQDQQPAAQQQGAQPQDPQTGVGRISVINGDVSTQRGDSGDWVADTINAPVAPGDTLSTAPRSRTEVQLDYANVLRLDHDTQVRVADLSKSRIQVQVANGLADYTILRDGGPNAEIDTPNLAIHPLGRGVYRIQVSSPTEAYVTVREGEAQVSTPQGSAKVTKGQTITVRGSDNPQYKVDEAQARDDWDHWNADRDKTILNAQSWRHTDPYYTGSEDLDAYGQWHNVPGYGDVWQPTQSPGWAPYSDGSWVWEPDWGYTWVSAEPWGWAPYHYGRWFFYNNAWAWWPGPIVGFGYQPIWAPAYVNFFGFGGLGFGFGFGSIGWLPVGPCDPFFPWWGRGGWGWGRGGWGRGWGRGWGWNGFNNTHVTNITNINDLRNVHGGVPPLAGANRPQFSNLQGAFSNPRIRGAISTVASSHFGHGRVPVAHGVTSAMLHNSSLVAGRVPVVPTKASLSASNRGPAASSIPRAGSTPTYFAGTQTVTANKGSFAHNAADSASSFGGQRGPGSGRQGQVADGASRSFGSAGTNGTGRIAPQAARSNPTSQAAVHGWQRFAGQGGAGTGAPSRGFALNRPQSSGFGAPSRTAPPASGNGTRSGWQSFSSQPPPRSSFASPGRSESSFGSRSAPGGYTSGWRSYGSGQPPSQMNRPMFSPRSAPSYGGGYGGFRSGGYNAPRSYGGYAGGHSSGGYAGGGGHFGGYGGGGHSGAGGHGGRGGRR